MARIYFDLDDSALQPLFEQIKERTDDLRPVLRRLGIIAIQKSAQKFAKQGPNWAPLAESTLKRRRGKAGRILEDSGRLKQSVVNAINGGSPGSVYELTNQSLEVGSNLVYAAIHQFGGVIHHAASGRKITTRKAIRLPNGLQRRGSKAREIVKASAAAKGGRIPARPFLPNADELQEQFQEVLQDYLDFG